MQLAKSAPSRMAPAKPAAGDENFALRSLQEAFEADKRYAASDDELLQFYVRQAAIVSRNVRRDHAPRAFLLALGVAFDSGALLAKAMIEGIPARTVSSAR
mgnify:CR=1 FL=1